MVCLSNIGSLKVGDTFVSAAAKDKRSADRYVISGDIEGKSRECWDVKKKQLVYKSCNMAVYKLTGDPSVVKSITDRYARKH
jgi:hypothetical protein